MGERFFVIGRSTCPFCIMAEDLLKASGKACTFLDYSASQHILEDYKEFYGQDTVPIILSNNLETGYTLRIGGYTDLLEHLNGKQRSRS